MQEKTVELTDTCFSNGIGLARACLSISKYGHVEAFKEGLHQRLHASPVHGLLAGCCGEDTVKVEMAVAAQGDLLSLWIALQAGLVPVQSLLGQQGSNAHGHPDPSLLHWRLGLGFQAHDQKWRESHGHWKTDISLPGRLQKEER